MTRSTIRRTSVAALTFATTTTAVLGIAIGSTASPNPASPQSQRVNSTFRATLTVAVDLTGSGAYELSTVTCGSTTPEDDANACAALKTKDGVAALKPVPAGAACTSEWGGQQIATIVGRINGKRVQSTFTMEDGCEMDRWESLLPVLGTPMIPDPAAASVADLEVTVDPTGIYDENGNVDPNGSADAVTISLICNPSDMSDDPEVIAACTAITTAGGTTAFTPVPGDAKCSDSWDGPRIAQVLGTVDGLAIETGFTRTNGCEIKRWDALGPVFDLASTGALLAAES